MRYRIIILVLILSIGFFKAAYGKDKQPECPGKNSKDQLVVINELYPWVLTTVREQEAKKIIKYRVNKKEDPNIKGSLP